MEALAAHLQVKHVLAGIMHRENAAMMYITLRDHGVRCTLGFDYDTDRVYIEASTERWTVRIHEGDFVEYDYMSDVLYVSPDASGAAVVPIKCESGTMDILRKHYAGVRMFDGTGNITRMGAAKMLFEEIDQLCKKKRK